MNDNGAGPVVFDISGWRGITIVKGSDEFFRQLRTLLELIPHITENYEYLLSDMQACLNSDSGDYYFNDSDEFCVLRFHHLNQITMTKRYAFDLGEAIFSSLKKANKETHYVNTLFAFAKKLQSAAVSSLKD